MIQVLIYYLLLTRWEFRILLLSLCEEHKMWETQLFRASGVCVYMVGVDIAEVLQGIFRKEISPGEGNRLTFFQNKTLLSVIISLQYICINFLPKYNCSLWFLNYIPLKVIMSFVKHNEGNSFEDNVRKIAHILKEGSWKRPVSWLIIVTKP